MFEVVRFLHMFLIILAFANFATTTIMQILHITLPTCNTVHNLHVNRKRHVCKVCPCGTYIVSISPQDNPIPSYRQMPY